MKKSRHFGILSLTYISAADPRGKVAMLPVLLKITHKVNWPLGNRSLEGGWPGRGGGLAAG